MIKQLVCATVLLLGATVLRADVFSFSYSGMGVSLTGTVTATETPDAVTVIADTVTPNLKGFQYRLNGGDWRTEPGQGTDPHSRRAVFTWPLAAGTNTLEIKPCNVFDRDGIISRVVVAR